ncbi:SOS-response transcriptional repressors [Pelotomaculum thermopropionicum SI]|uniref:SOS-response transcriptional repressors n=1 Tax=Pelotomaculum thermopropionicum (strain DSM 13744 / JCM 10971 / SI) TaxID=370438 RepID=A5D283_PELTS|nr:SOS-response transcriptional repressors [Pelotomaculum thermopropionicum SI]
MYFKIGARIKKAREEKYLTQAELGVKLGVSATAINYYEKGKRKIGIDDLYRMANALGKPLEYFLGRDVGSVGRGDKQPSGSNRENINNTFNDMTGIPVLGTVSAGELLYSEQNISGYLPFPRKMADGKYFALRVKGDSMTGEGIYDGDLVLIRRQSHVDFNGQIVCALVNGEENTLKIFLQDENGNILLKAANPAYPDIVLQHGKDALVIQGVFAGVFKFPKGL